MMVRGDQLIAGRETLWIVPQRIAPDAPAAPPEPPAAEAAAPMPE
jgi:hypothetical protein